MGADEQVIEIPVEVFQDHFPALFAGYCFIQFVMLACVTEEFENEIYFGIPACMSRCEECLLLLFEEGAKELETGEEQFIFIPEVRIKS